MGDPVSDKVGDKPEDKVTGGAGDGRDETDEERLDRKWNELLQELRVMQTGAQLTAGFLLTLPFQSTFTSLDGFATGLYLVLVLLAALVTALVMAPVAIHRRLSGHHVKERLVVSAHLLVHGVLTCIGLLVTGMVLLIFDMVLDRTWASIAAACVALVIVLLLVALPLRLIGRDDD
jgi:hypothetical protein